jgi:hypothetical protein
LPQQRRRAARRRVELVQAGRWLDELVIVTRLG